jgi:hypothetical protein
MIKQNQSNSLKDSSLKGLRISDADDVIASKTHSQSLRQALRKQIGVGQYNDRIS